MGIRQRQLLTLGLEFSIVCAIIAVIFIIGRAII